MEESEDNLNADDNHHLLSPGTRGRPKKRSLVERELETNLTARVTSPITTGDGCSTSRYGRARRSKNEADISESDKVIVKSHKSPRLEKSPKPNIQSPVYKMHASNSPIKNDVTKTESNFDNHIEDIYTENNLLSRFGSSEKKKSPSKRYPKVYIRQDLIQTKDKDKEMEETVVLIKNMFSPVKSTSKGHTKNQERSIEKYRTKRLSNSMDTPSVVKTLDFDEKKVKKEVDNKASSSTNDNIFELEANSEYQVGDLAWARMGTYPFWPCIITREPESGLFVKTKLFGRNARSILNVTFFGDKGRRSWIADSMLRPFLGQLEFEMTRSQFTPEAKKKDPKLYTAFFISERKMNQWIVSVEEAEMLLREPKRLRLDILNSMLMNVKPEKVTPKHEKSKRVTRTDSDVSLSESLYDTLFSEDDTKGNDSDRSRNKIKNKSLDVSEVVTACLDNMAAKTGMTKIQRQSHMDRWLLKAKTKTPEKSHLKSHAVPKAAPNSSKVKKLPKLNLKRTPYKFRSRHNESQNSDSLNLNTSDSNCFLVKEKEIMLRDCNESTHNFESSATEDIDSKHDIKLLPLNDKSCINYKSNESENTSIETCNVNSIDSIDNKSVLDKLKQSIESDGDNIPSSSSADVSAMSTSLEISRVDDQTSDIDMISKTTDMSLRFLEITSDGTCQSSQIDEHLDKDKFYQSRCITSSPEGDLKDSSPSSCTETLNDETIGCMGKLSHDNQIVDINTDRDINHIGESEKTKKNPEEESENIGTTKLLKDQNNDKMKNCTEKANIDNVNQNIPLNENVSCVVLEINDSECNETKRDLGSNSPKIKITLAKENESMPLDEKSDFLENSLNYTSSHNSNIEKEKEKDEKNLNESDTSILKGEINVKNNFCNGVLEEASKECSNFCVDRNYKKRNRTIDKSTHRNLYESVEKQEICDPIKSCIVDDTTKKAINHLKPNTKSNKIYKCDVNSGIHTKKSNNNEIDKISNANSKDKVCKKFNLSLCKYNIVSDDHNNINFTKNEITNNVQGFNLIETKTIISSHDHSDDKQRLNQTVINNCEKKADNNNYVENVEKSSMNVEKILNSEIKVISNTLTREKIVDKHKEEPYICAKAPKNEQKQDSNRDPLISSKYENKDSLIGVEELISQDKPHKEKDRMDTALTFEESDLSTQEKHNFKKSETVKINYADPAFRKYLEFKQDAVMDENPEFSQEQITSYLYNTWLYEESNKSETKKSDEIDQTSLVKGTNYKALDKDRGRIKLKTKKPSDINLNKTILPHTTNILTILNGYHKENDLVKEKNITKQNKNEVNQPDKNIIDFTKNNCVKNQTATVNDSGLGKLPDNTGKHKIQTPQTESEVTNHPKNDPIGSINSDANCSPLSPTQLHKLQKNDEMSQATVFMLNDSITKVINKIAEDLKTGTKLKNSAENITVEDSQKGYEMSKDTYDSNINTCKIFAEDTETKLNNSIESESEKNECKDSAHVTISLKENTNLTKNVETVSVISDESESIKKKKYISKKSLEEKSMGEDPGFQKYLEFKQDSVIEENPDLSREEVISYLYKTWLYEEDNKSDKKKSDEVDQTSLVKGVNRTNLDKEKGRRRLIRKTPEDFKDPKTKQTTPTIINHFITQNGYHDFNKLLHTKEIELETFESDKNIVNTAQNVSLKSKENDEIHREKLKDVDFESKLFEKPDASCSIANCEEEQLEIDEKTSCEESLKDDDNLDSASITSADSEKSLSRTRQLWKYERDHVSVISKSFEKPDVSCSIAKCDEEQLEKDEKTSNEEPLKDEDDNFDRASIISADSEMSLSRRRQLWKEKHSDKRDDVVVLSKSFEKPDTSCSIANSDEERLERYETTSNEEPLKDEDDDFDSASIISADSEMSLSRTPLSRRRQLWKEKHSDKRDHVVVVSKLVEKPDTNCSIAKCDEEQLDKDEKTSNEEPLEDEDDNFESASIISADSEMSLSRKRKNWKAKHMQDDKRIALEDSEFVRYLELRQDSVMDENPELSEEEITNYLYNIWLYEVNKKVDKKRSDEIDQTTLVKGVEPEPGLKKVRRKLKIVKEDSQESFKISEDIEVCPKEKSKRSIARPYYNEEFLDEDDEMGLFEIFRTKKNTTKPIVRDLDDKTPQEMSLIPKTEVINTEEINAEEIYSDEVDLVEWYFEQLTMPKPNVFKGLTRERVCEICEKVGNLVKCKTCHCMFHIECVKKQTKTSEELTPNKGRKKKRKYRRRLKNSEDTFLDSESHSDERTQDANSDPNVSIESEIEPIVADAEDFEAKASAKMKEILGDLDSIAYDYESSKVAIPWNISEPGKCQIVDVKLQIKRREEVVDTSNFKCHDCEKFETPICFVCKSPVSPVDKVEYRQKCQVAHCYKHYHLECLDHWPQTQFNGGESRNKKNKDCFEAMSCPRHVCHTCVSDDPRGCKTRFSGDKLARCVRCPATYHSFTKCLPAGSQILTGSLIICPRHYEHRPGKVPCHVNTGWCFICALGGTLICCEYCPTSFHAECLNIDPPEGGYMCEDCETGRLPLYGEMVWVKLGHYRWWPGIILHPSQIPYNILAVKHSQGEFVVRFFGQYDHYWVNRGRVFPFQEGDTGKISSQRSKIDAAFTMAVEHASRACEILKNAVENVEENQDIASSLLPPHYVKLRVNRPVGSLTSRRPDLEESSLTQCDCDPGELEPCGAYTQCLNRMLLTECGPTCRAGDRCNNRAFEKRLYPKMEPYRTPHRGWGLKCLEDVKAGQFVIEYVGELLDEAEFQRRMRRKHEVRDENFYFLTLDKERMIDAGPKGNLARFMNHSCEPNCETQKWTVLGDVRVGLFAMYDIPAHSELTFNYNLESAGIEKKQCMCGAKRCSGYIGAKPKQDDPQPKKNKLNVKKTHKKRKPVETSPAGQKPKQRIGRPCKPKELTEIEKDLLIIKSATHTSSDSEHSERLSIDSKDSKGFKRKRTAPDNLTLCIKRVKTGDREEFRID